MPSGVQTESGGDDIYSMTHCYGLRECGERLMVRDKNTIRGYWIYEAVTEPAFRVPWIGKVKVPEGVGYDYQPVSMVWQSMTGVCI